MMLLISLAIFLPKILMGFAIANILWRERTFSAVVLKLAAGVPLGLWFGSSLFFLASLAGIPPLLYSRAELGAGVVFSILLLARQHPPLTGYKKRTPFSRQIILPTAIVLSGIVLAVGAFFYYSRMHPYGFEDAWSIWNITPRFMYRLNSTDPLLDSTFYPRFHPDYPVELGLNVAWGWFVLGSDTTRVPIAVAFLATFTPAAILWAVLYRWKGILPGALGAFILLMTPHLPSAVGQYADPLVSLHMAGAAAFLYESLKSTKPGPLFIGGLLAGSSAWVKNEGIMFAAVFIFICLLAAWKQDTRRVQVKWLFLFLFLPLVIVLLYKLTVSGQSDLFHDSNLILAQLLDLSRWQVIGWSFITGILDFGRWPISAIVVLFVYAAMVGVDKKNTRQDFWLSGIVLGQLAGYFFIYLITPHDLQLHIRTSMDRLISHVYPVLVLSIFALVRPPDTRLGSAAIRDMEPEASLSFTA